MSVPNILSYVNAMLSEWGIMPYVQAGMIILIVISAIVYLRRLGTGS